MISLTIHVRDFSPMKESRKTWVNLLARNGRWAPLRPSARIHSCKNRTINPYYKYAGSSHVFINTRIVHFSSWWYYLLLKKASMRYTLSLKSFLNNACVTVPLFLWLTKALPRPFIHMQSQWNIWSFYWFLHHNLPWCDQQHATAPQQTCNSPPII